MPYVSVFLYAGLVLALIVIPGIWLKALDIFAYEATIGTLLVVLVYLLTNLALSSAHAGIVRQIRQPPLMSLLP